MQGYIALVVSAFSLGWNVYRDIILKPRLKVTVDIRSIVTSAGSMGKYINISVVNFGPGPITLMSIYAQKWSIIRKMKRLPSFAFIMHDYENPLSSRLPKKLEMGEQVNLLLPFKEDAILARKPTHLGVSDSFGRTHWAKSKYLKEAIKDFLKDFPEVDWDTGWKEELKPKSNIKAI